MFGRLARDRHSSDSLSGSEPPVQGYGLSFTRSHPQDSGLRFTRSHRPQRPIRIQLFATIVRSYSGKICVEDEVGEGGSVLRKSIGDRFLSTGTVVELERTCT